MGDPPWSAGHFAIIFWLWMLSYKRLSKSNCLLIEMDDYSYAEHLLTLRGGKQMADELKRQWNRLTKLMSTSFPLNLCFMLSQSLSYFMCVLDKIHEWNWFPLVQSTLTLEGVIRSVMSRGSNLTLSLQVCTQACPFDCQITYCTHHWTILYFKYIKDLLHLLLSKGTHPHYSLTGYFLMNHACLLSVNYHKRQLISEKYNWIKQWPSNRNSLQYKELVFKFCAWQI